MEPEDLRLTELRSKIEALAAAHVVALKRIEVLEARAGVAPEAVAPADAAELAKAFFDEADRRIARPLATCVQCGATFDPSLDGDGHCAYHPSPPMPPGSSRQRYPCCQAEVRRYGAPPPPCTRGRHADEHHVSYPYEGYIAWIGQIASGEAEVWASIDGIDFVEGARRSLRTGILGDGRIFVRTRHGAAITDQRAVLFDAEALAAGSGEIFAYTGEGWRITASRSAGEEGTVLIDLVLKLPQHAAETHERLVVRAGALVERQALSVPAPALPERASARELPAPVVEGSDIEEPPTAEAATHECVLGEGAVLRLRQQGAVEASQEGSYGQVGPLVNHFYFGLTVLNASEGDTSIADVRCRWRDASGAWQPCGPSELGERYTGHRDVAYRWWDRRTARVEAQGTTELAVHARVDTTGRAGNGFALNRRGHPSLPQPITLEVAIEDVEGRITTLCVEQCNRPLGLPTASDQNPPAHFWLNVDDSEALKRTVFSVARGDGEDRLRLGSTTYSFDDARWHRIAFDAKRAEQAEVPLEQLGSSTVAVWALVDLQAERVYGLKVRLSSDTGSKTAWCTLPPVT